MESMVDIPRETSIYVPRALNDVGFAFQGGFFPRCMYGLESKRGGKDTMGTRTQMRDKVGGSLMYGRVETNKDLQKEEAMHRPGHGRVVE